MLRALFSPTESNDSSEGKFLCVTFSARPARAFFSETIFFFFVGSGAFDVSAANKSSLIALGNVLTADSRWSEVAGPLMSSEPAACR